MSGFDEDVVDFHRASCFAQPSRPGEPLSFAMNRPGLSVGRVVAEVDVDFAGQRSVDREVLSGPELSTPAALAPQPD